MTVPLTMTRTGETELCVSRRFPVSADKLYRAHTEPDLLKQWMLGPDGWHMPVCVCDARSGGEMRFVWENDAGESFYLTGEFKALEPYRRIVHVERMFLPDPTPDTMIETLFDPDDSGTLLTQVMRMADAETLEAMLESGMEQGMEQSYARLDGLFPEPPPEDA